MKSFKDRSLKVFSKCICHCLCLCLFVGHFACTNSCVLSCRSSTCATRTGGGSPTCAATTPASTRSSGSATGTTTSTVPTLLTGQFPTSVLDLHIFFMALLQVLLERPDLQNRPSPSRAGEKGSKPGLERRRRLLCRRGQH